MTRVSQLTKAADHGPQQSVEKIHDGWEFLAFYCDARPLGWPAPAAAGSVNIPQPLHLLDDLFVGPGVFLDLIQLSF